MGNDSRFIMNYTAFNTTDSQALNVKAGDTIHAEIVMDGGTYTVTVIGEKAKGSVKYIVKTSENENKLIHKKTK